MKKLFFVLLVSLNLNLNSQTYTPLVQDSLVWQVMYASMDEPWPPTFFYDHRNYYTLGDTAINNHTYNKLYTCPSAWQFPNCASSGELLGFLRENDKTVYFRKNTDLINNAFVTGMYFKIGSDSINDTTEYLLYDFNWEPNDTIFSDTTGFGNDAYKIIEDLSYIVNGNDTLNVYNIHSTICGMDDEYIIERIGSTYGLFELYMDCFEGGTCLSRFADLKTGFNYWSTSSYCYGVGVKEATPATQVSVYSAYNTIYIKNLTLKPLAYYLYNISGSLVTSGNTNGTEVNINAVQGFYLLQTIDNNGIAKTYKLSLLNNN